NSSTVRSCRHSIGERKCRHQKSAEALNGYQFDAKRGDSEKKETPQTVVMSRLTRLGFEPRLTEPKSVVLPLHYRAMVAEARTPLRKLTTDRRFRNRSLAEPVAHGPLKRPPPAE